LLPIHPLKLHMTSPVSLRHAPKALAPRRAAEGGEAISSSIRVKNIRDAREEIASAAVAASQ